MFARRGPTTIAAALVGVACAWGASGATAADDDDLPGLFRELDYELGRRGDDDSRADLRRRLAAVERGTLRDADWIDLHLALRALDRRLSPELPRVIPAGEGGAGETSMHWFDVRCRDDGLLPIGEAAYAQILRDVHGIDLSPLAVLRTGEMALAGVTQRLEAFAAAQAAGRSWRELVADSRLDRPSLPAGVPTLCDTLVDAAFDAFADSPLVTVPEDLPPLDVRVAARAFPYPYAVYEFRRRVAGGFRPAVISVPQPPRAPSAEALDEYLGDFDVHWLRLVAGHEGVPGHHLQMVRAAEVGSHVRPRGYNAAYVEGWAFYAEHLLGRAGVLANPLDRFAELRMQAWRAARCRVDAALHLGRMAPSEALRVLVEEAGISQRAAEMDVRQSLRSPTHGMSYWIGRRLIERMHDDYMVRHGPESEREFHDRLLGLGVVPLPLAAAVLLEQRDAYDAAHP